MLSVPDGPPRFAESIPRLQICAGASSHERYVQVVALKAAHTNATVRAPSSSAVAHNTL